MDGIGSLLVIVAFLGVGLIARRLRMSAVLDAPEGPYTNVLVPGSEPLREALVFLRLELEALVHDDNNVDFTRLMSNNTAQQRVEDQAYRETRLIELVGALSEAWAALPPEVSEQLRERGVVYEQLRALQDAPTPRDALGAGAMIQALDGLLARFCAA